MLSGEARFSGRTAAEALDGVLASIEPPPDGRSFSVAAEREQGRTAIGLRSSWIVSTGLLWTFAALAVLAILARMGALASLLVFLLLIGLTSRLWGERALHRVLFSVRGEPAPAFSRGGNHPRMGRWKMINFCR